MNARGFTLIELMITLAIAGVVSLVLYLTYSSDSERQQAAYHLVKQSDKLLSVSAEYYRSSCREPDFQLTLTKLKEKQLISNDFNFPAHTLRLTSAQTAAAYLHLEITLDNSVAATFAETHQNARLIDANTVVISIPVASQLLPERQRLVTMKTLWGENNAC